MAISLSASKLFSRHRLPGGKLSILLPLPGAVADFSSNSNAASYNTITKETREFKWSKLWLFLPGAITFGLGTWQIFRRQEKIKTLEHIKTRLDQEPIMFNAASPNFGDINELEFRKMSFKGVFDESKSIFVGPRSRSISGVTENGYYIITPLMPVPGSTESIPSPVLVNRGWVPRTWKDKGVPKAETSNERAASTEPEGKQKSSWIYWSKNPKKGEREVPPPKCVEITGVARDSEHPSIFVPENDPYSGQWFYVDVPAMARACGLPEETIYVDNVSEYVNPSCPYPLAKDPNLLVRSSVMPQDHLNYTFTWYTLSAAVTFLAHKRVNARHVR